MAESPKRIIYSEYFRYRIDQRGFSETRVEEILRYATERYADQDSGRQIVVGPQGDGVLILIAYEETASALLPVTVHATTRQQIRFRLSTGRYVNE